MGSMFSPIFGTFNTCSTQLDKGWSSALCARCFGYFKGMVSRRVWRYAPYHSLLRSITGFRVFRVLREEDQQKQQEEAAAKIQVRSTTAFVPSLVYLTKPKQNPPLFRPLVCVILNTEHCAHFGYHPRPVTVENYFFYINPPQKKHNCLEASGVSSFWGSQLFSRFGSFGSPGFRFQNLAFGVSRFWGPQLFRRFGHSEYPV